MPDIQQAIFSQLTNFAGLSALIAARAYPLMLPQNPTLPAVVYQIISNEREELHGGQTGDARPRFQITCWAATQAAVAAVATQVRLAVMSMAASVASVTIKGTYNAGETHIYEPDTKRYGVALDFFVAHEEAVA